MSGTKSYKAIGDRDAARYRDEAALGIIEAQLACLHRRRAVADDVKAQDLAGQIRDAVAARQAVLARVRAQRRA